MKTLKQQCIDIYTKKIKANSPYAYTGDVDKIFAKMNSNQCKNWLSKNQALENILAKYQ